MYDLRGDYRSIICGYNKENVYSIGLISEDRNQDRIAYKVLSARMKTQKKLQSQLAAIKMMRQWFL